MSTPTETVQRPVLKFVILTVAAVLTAGPAPAADSGVEEHRFPDRIVWETEFAHSGATFRLVGAEGEVLRREYAPGEPLVQPLIGSKGDALADGRYTYELRIRGPASTPDAEPVRVTGGITVRHGAAVAEPIAEEQALPREPAVVDEQVSGGTGLERKSSHYGECKDSEIVHYQEAEEACFGDFCDHDLNCGCGLCIVTRPDRSVFDLWLRDLQVGLHFEDASSDTNSPQRDWILQVNDRNGSDEFFALVDCGDDCNPDPEGTLEGWPDDPADAYPTPLFIEGGVHDDTIYLSFDNVGFGTVPAEDLHVYDANPTLMLEDSSDGTHGRIRYNVGLLVLEGNSNQNIVSLDGKAPHGSIHVNAGGRVGLGTATPVEDLHLLSNGPTIVLEDRVDETFARLRYASGRLLLQGNSGQSIVDLDGEAPTRSILVDADGDISLGAGVSTTSSRTAKAAFEPVDRDALLEKIAALPVSTWIYKRDSDRARHLGPVAEDFHATFGLGKDARHISLTDLAGVAVAGVQGLQGALAEAEEETDELRDENRELRARVDELEALADGLLQRLAALEQGAGALE